MTRIIQWYLKNYNLITKVEKVYKSVLRQWYSMKVFSVKSRKKKANDKDEKTNNRFFIKKSLKSKILISRILVNSKIIVKFSFNVKSKIKNKF